MRIIIHDYAGHAFPTDLSRELARRGHTVSHAFASNLVTPRGDLARRADDPASLMFFEVAMDARYPKLKYSFIKRRGLEVSYGKAAAKHILDFKPDVVLSGNTPTDAQQHLLKATRQIGGKFIGWIQDFYGIAVDKLVRKKMGIGGIPIGLFYRRLDRRIMVGSDHNICITEDFVPLLLTEGVRPEKITTLPNWAILNEIAPQPKQNPWSIKNGLGDKFVFLYTGTLGMKHNPTLLSQIAEAFKSEPRVRVVVVSEGPGADWLREAKLRDGIDNLLLLPYQSFKQLPQMLGAGDALLAILEPDAGVFSVPSKVLSYFCAGRPLLLAVPKENLAARMVKGASAGLVSSPEDPETLISHARQMFNEGSQRSDFGTRARRFAEDNFSIASIADGFESVLIGSLKGKVE